MFARPDLRIPSPGAHLKDHWIARLRRHFSRIELVTCNGELANHNITHVHQISQAFLKDIVDIDLVCVMVILLAL